VVIAIVDDDVASSYARRVTELRTSTADVLKEVRRDGNQAAAAGLGFALEAFDETLLRLGALAGDTQDAQQDPLVFGVQPRVRPDQ
jgi:hypothetical protein